MVDPARIPITLLLPAGVKDPEQKELKELIKWVGIEAGLSALLALVLAPGWLALTVLSLAALVWNLQRIKAMQSQILLREGSTIEISSRGVILVNRDGTTIRTDWSEYSHYRARPFSETTRIYRRDRSWFDLPLRLDFRIQDAQMRAGEFLLSSMAQLRDRRKISMLDILAAIWYVTSVTLLFKSAEHPLSEQTPWILCFAVPGFVIGFFGLYKLLTRQSFGSAGLVDWPKTGLPWELAAVSVQFPTQLEPGKTYCYVDRDRISQRSESACRLLARLAMYTFSLLGVAIYVAGSQNQALTPGWILLPLCLHGLTVATILLKIDLGGAATFAIDHDTLEMVYPNGKRRSFPHPEYLSNEAAEWMRGSSTEFLSDGRGTVGINRFLLEETMP